MGAGIIGLPYALYHAGFILGLFLLILVAWIVDYGVKQMVLCGVKVRKTNFEDVMEYSFGHKGFYAVAIAMSIFAFGAMCAYHVVIGDTITPIIATLFPDSFLNNRQLIVFLYSFIFMLPLSLLKNMSSLAWSSSLSIISVLVIVIIVCIEAPKRNPDEVLYRTAYTFAEKKAVSGVGAMAFAFVCHHSSFIVYNSLKDATTKRWSIVTHASLGISLGLCVLLAVSGYLNFQTDTKGDILNNFSYDNTAVNFARGLLALTMVFTFPMENFVVRHCIFATLKRRDKITETNYNWYHYIITLLLWGSALTVGLFVDDLGIVLEIVGIIGGSLIGFIFPGSVILRVKGYNNLLNNISRSKGTDKMNSILEFILPLFIVVFGCLVFLLGIASLIAFN